MTARRGALALDLRRQHHCQVKEERNPLSGPVGNDWGATPIWGGTRRVEVARLEAGGHSR
jgi:hypothetical protein